MGGVVCKRGRDVFHKPAPPRPPTHGKIIFDTRMRLLLTILAALSTLLLIFTLFFYVRSYSRYEGVTHFTEGGSETATASANGKTVEMDVSGRCSGWISYKGQLTYVSMVDPVKFESWENWSQPLDQPMPAKGAMVLVSDARLHSGLGGGKAKTRSELTDPVMGVSWRLPYHYFTIPYWALVLLFAILPWRWGSAFRLAVQREKAGLCVRCGKSIQGQTGKCANCGEPIPE